MAEVTLRRATSENRTSTLKWGHPAALTVTGLTQLGHNDGMTSLGSTSVDCFDDYGRHYPRLGLIRLGRSMSVMQMPRPQNETPTMSTVLYFEIKPELG
jgi:hypothetical protein